jgi:hypothetical protein
MIETITSSAAILAVISISNFRASFGIITRENKDEGGQLGKSFLSFSITTGSPAKKS